MNTSAESAQEHTLPPARDTSQDGASSLSRNVNREGTSSASANSGQPGAANSLADLGQRGALDTVWAQLREITGQFREVVEQLQRQSGRRAWRADMRALPAALRWALPWAILGRTSRDANPCRWLERQAKQRPDVVAVSDRARSLTFAQLRLESLAVAASLRRSGVTTGDHVAILLPTGTELVATLLGCWRLGASPCPLDPDTPGSVLEEVRSQLDAKLEIGSLTQLSDLCDSSFADRAELAQTSASARGERAGNAAVSEGPSRSNPPTPYFPMHAAQMAMILPTSGSEGHVKLCRITAGRLALSGHAFGGVALGCRRGDVIYCPLPLYHATGITVGLMPALVHGVTLHLPGKFSASKLLQELCDTRATQLVYVGDLLRMAVAATRNDGAVSGSGAPTKTTAAATTNAGLDASSEVPAAQRLRVAVGNGLDQATYQSTTKVLKIPRIVEFYGATEAPRVLLNLSQRAGSCGRVALRRMSRFVVVKQSARAPNGVEPTSQPDRSDWVLCKPGEIGELWIRIPSRRRPWLGDFEGYLHRDQENRALMRDVFRPGDRFYRTYDLVRHDKDDYFYFVDRLGDVWRNLGHNVSTSWLANELRHLDGVSDACVFPVALDDSTRRFGLALLVLSNEECGRDALTKKIHSLPRYAQPQLIHLLPAIPRTHSYKPKRWGGAGTQFQPATNATVLLIWDRGVLREIEHDEWQMQCQRLLGS